MKAWKLAWLNLKRSPLVSILLIFAMSLALGTMGLLYRVESLQTQRWTQIAEWAPVVVGAKQGGLDLLLATSLLEVRNLELIPYKLFETIRAKQDISFEDKTKVSNQQIELAVPLLFMAQARKHWIVGTDASVQNLLRKNGFSNLSDGAWFQNDREVVLGAKMAEHLAKHVGDSLEADLLGPVGEQLFQTTTLKVSGIMPVTHTAWDQAAFGDLRLGWLVYSKLDLSKVSIWGPQVLHYFWLSAADSNTSSMAGLQSLINQRSIAQLAFVGSEREHLNSLLGQTREMSLLISGLILLICFIALLALMIFRHQSQSSQIAVLRALGFSSKKLMGWFSLEALYLLVFSLFFASLWTQIFWWLTASMMRESVTFLTASWISPSLEWPVWLCGGLAFAISLLGPWLLSLKEDLHESIRV